MFRSPNCPPEEKAAIVELDRTVFIPHFGFTKLPPGVIRLPGTKAAFGAGKAFSQSSAIVQNLREEPERAATDSAPDKQHVFVVHGRNEPLRRSMFDFLRAIGLKPLEWSQAVSATGEGTPYIGQVLDNALAIARALVVLLTPDDEAYLKRQFQTEHDADYEKKPTGQARPNVLFEAGMAFGRNPKRTVLVEIGILRPFSDVAGRHVVRLDNSVGRRQDLAERLRAAGCDVDLSGRDWHTVGSFTVDNSPKTSPYTTGTGTVESQAGTEVLELRKQELLRRKEEDRRTSMPHIRWRGGVCEFQDEKWDFENVGAEVYEITWSTPEGVAFEYRPRDIIRSLETGWVHFIGERGPLIFPLRFSLSCRTRIGEVCSKTFEIEQPNRQPKEIEHQRP